MNLSRDPSENKSANNRTIVVAGATGHLGSRICAHLLHSGVHVIALVRNADTKQAALLKQQGIILSEVDFNNKSQLAKACAGADCIVSALNGVEDVIVDMQIKLLEAAISARVTRFIPSDYCIDYTKLTEGSNRNLDLRRRFNEHLNKAPISATSILNGMFTDLLTGDAPLVLFKIKRVLYWGNRDQLMDFTTMENTAEYTARAAIDMSTPRYLRIAGDVQNANGLKTAASNASGHNFRLFRAGGLGLLRTMITITRTLFPKRKEVFPPWQGMQYLHNMLTGKPKLEFLDNDRYPGIKWTKVEEVLKNRQV